VTDLSDKLQKPFCWCRTLPTRELKEFMDRKRFSQLCCLILLTSAALPPVAQGQGGGMGGMGGMGGLRNSPSIGGGQNDPPPEPEKPVVKYNPFGPDAAPVTGLDARTAALERFIFGHSDMHPKMKVRVQRLEKRLVPYEHHDPSNKDFEKRIDHLWSTLEAGNRGSTRAPGDTPSKDSGSKDAGDKDSGGKDSSKKGK
jgi:hypothetical protein